MATVLSMINMKGGVGKTTLAMHLAYAASTKGYKTLVVNLDPQSNISQVIIGPKAYVDYLAAKKINSCTNFRWLYSRRLL